ncbi:MAG: hypothetical protein MZU91_12205 [Desulfosudis oleivorans]|nr:hypothetical protein [Desulfosudis oleivorans]
MTCTGSSRRRRSRFEVIEVQAPTPVQMPAVVASVQRQLIEESDWSGAFGHRLDAGVMAALRAQTPRECAPRARRRLRPRGVHAGRKVLTVADIEKPRNGTARSIGFGLPTRRPACKRKKARPWARATRPRRCSTSVRRGPDGCHGAPATRVATHVFAGDGRPRAMSRPRRGDLFIAGPDVELGEIEFELSRDDACVQGSLRQAPPPACAASASCVVAQGRCGRMDSCGGRSAPNAKPPGRCEAQLKRGCWRNWPSRPSAKAALGEHELSPLLRTLIPDCAWHDKVLGVLCPSYQVNLSNT